MIGAAIGAVIGLAISVGLIFFVHAPGPRWTPMSPQVDEMLTLDKLLYELGNVPEPWCFGLHVFRAYLTANFWALRDGSKVKWSLRQTLPPDWDGVSLDLQIVLDLKVGETLRGYYVVEELPGSNASLTWHSPDGQKEPPIEVECLWFSDALKERAGLAQLPVRTVGEVPPVATPGQLGVPS